MGHRVGVCGSCRARFQIPSTFTPNRARCRTCGGVVEIGAPQTSPQGTPPPTPARVENRPEPRPVPAEVQPIRSPAQVEVRPAAPPPAPVAAVARAIPARPLPKKRSVLVPALVAAGVLVLLIVGAIQLLGHDDSVTASRPSPPSENEDSARAAEPKAKPSAAEDTPTPR